ncbi:MAG: NifU family protein [Pseudomonadota bacterium]
MSSGARDGAVRRIEFEATPNPDAMRILPGRRLANGPARQFVKGITGGPAIASALLAVDGVARVLIGPDFVTVVRDDPCRAWDTLRPEILWAVADALDGQPEPEAVQAPEPAPELGDIERQIEDVLARWVRPMLAADGGDAVLERFDHSDGTAWVRMEGACGGCPSGSTTLKRGIEQTVRRWVPEVTRVRAAEPALDANIDPKARFRQWIASKWGRG